MSSTALRIAHHQHALLACRALRSAPLHTLLHERGDGQDAEDIDWPRCATAGHALLPDHALAQRLLAGLHEAWRLGLLRRTLVPVAGDPAAYRVQWQRRSGATQSPQPPVLPGVLVAPWKVAPKAPCGLESGVMGNPVLATYSPLLAPICHRHRIRRLALFGSQLKGTARPDSDIDLLVEFHPAARPTLLDMAQIESELSAAFQGRKVDLRTAQDLSPYFRDEVLRTAQVCHDAG